MERRSNQRVAAWVAAITIGMFAMAYAAVPIYRVFCKVTGYGGTTQVAEAYATSVGSREITVRFDSNIDADLPWSFSPEQTAITLRTGENGLAFYQAENLSDAPVTGMAVYNVTPDKAGIYFNKVHCFCFDEQTLKPHEKMMMPVSFFVDPALEMDRNLDDVDTITLSYSFFRFEKKE